MAKSRVGGKNGSFTATTHFADWVSFEIETTQEVEEDTAYGDTQASHIGNGLPKHRITASGFLFKGVASSAPGLASVSDVGGAMTATSDTGCNHAGTLIVDRVNITNNRRGPASGCTMSGLIDGALAETWAVS